MLSSLHHDGIPKTVEQFSDDRTKCIVREYIIGSSLSELLLERRFSVRQTAIIGKKVCSALTYLHTRPTPIIHRDLKPANIIIGSGGEVTLIDFGASRMLTDPEKTDTQFSATALYSPPEQYGYMPTSERSDIYSLGVIMNRMVYGSKTPKRARLSGFGRLIGKCTAFSPDKRFKSASELSSKLTFYTFPLRRLFMFLMSCAVLTAMLFGWAGAYVKYQNIAAEKRHYSPGQYSYDSHLYQVMKLDFDTTDIWSYGKRQCEMFGGHLATITSPEENEFVYSMLCDNNVKRAIFGLSSPDGENWSWITGEPFEYSNWGNGEPSFDFYDMDYGMYYDVYTHGEWNDGDTMECEYYICEWDYPEKREYTLRDAFLHLADIFSGIFS